MRFPSPFLVFFIATGAVALAQDTSTPKQPPPGNAPQAQPAPGLPAPSPKGPAQTSPTPASAGGTVHGQAAAAQNLAQSFFGLGAPPDPAAVDRGQKTYVANCGFCHGTNANGGNTGPDLVRSVLVLHDEGKGTDIGPVILNGRPARGMPKFAFNDAQIKDIAAFLLSRSQSTANRMNYKILNVVTGNDAAGKAYFSAHCASCHSVTDDLAHVAKKYDPVALQSRFLYPMERRFPGMPAGPANPRADTKVTVTLPSGQKYTGVLEHIDDFNAMIRDKNGKIQKVAVDEGSGAQLDIQDPLKGHEDLLKTYSDADMHNILAYLETLK